MFPPLSALWAEQVADQKNWKQFQLDDFARLQKKYGVSWVVVEKPDPAHLAAAGLTCPYENYAVRVCRLN
jgi:hypothetical protein